MLSVRVGTHSRKKTLTKSPHSLCATLYRSCPREDWSPGEIWRPVCNNILSYYSLSTETISAGCRAGGGMVVRTRLARFVWSWFSFLYIFVQINMYNIYTTKNFMEGSSMGWKSILVLRRCWEECTNKDLMGLDRGIEFTVIVARRNFNFKFVRRQIRFTAQCV